jgi:hypothetical protein
MTRATRFGKLEPERERTRPGSPPSPSLEDRFGAGTPEDDVPEAADATSLVRCALCRKDSPVSAESCASCGAAFSTPEQRAFNEALEKRRQLVRESQLRAEEKVALARRTRDERQGEEREARQEQERVRRESAQETHASFTSDPIGHVAREVGGAIGKSLARLFPSLWARLAFVSGSLLLGGVVLYLSPWLRALSCFGMVALVFLLASLSRTLDFLRRR